MVRIILGVPYIVLILFLFLINYYNISVISSTLSRDGESLTNAETFLSYFCHRMPSRSIWISEVPMGLCSRCTGIYMATLISLLFFLFNKRYLTGKYLSVFLILLFPIIIDGSFQLAGLYLSNNILRLTTGIFFGISLAYLITYLISLPNLRRYYESNKLF